MERNFISIDGLRKVLSPKEMMNVTGGSGGGDICGGCSGSYCESPLVTGIYVCCGEDMASCYEWVKTFLGDSHSCGNC